MKVHKLTAGRVRGPRRPRGARRYLQLEWSDATFPVNAFLIEHPQGLCLVDAGQCAAAARPGYLPRWHPFVRILRFELGPEDEVAAQIRGLGYTASDIRWVVLTHLHPDHVGGLAPFTSSTVIVSAREWQRASGLGGRLLGYVPQQWPREITPQLVRIDGRPVGPFAASLDLVDDGSVRLVPLPGHTPGQIGVLVTGEHGGALAGGDLVHSWRELPARWPELAEFCRQERVTFLAAHDDESPRTVDFSHDRRESRSA